MKRLLLAIPLAAAVGCTPIPQLSERIPEHIKNAPYPELIPLDRALGPSIRPEEEAAELQEQLEARRERLASRAREMQGPVLDQADRDRLDHEITQ